MKINTSSTKKNNASIIGVLLKKARKKANLTQEELSKKAEISRSYLSDLERGRYTPSVDTLVSLSILLNIDLNKIKNDGNTRKDVNENGGLYNSRSGKAFKNIKG